MDDVATNKRRAAAIMIDAGLSLTEVQAFMDSNYTRPHVLMDDVQAHISDCGGVMGFSRPRHPSWDQ